ncbi:hypothetical protein H4R19_000526 [Coemansia spiralis]|nr:hypothetical protein H4R19_000526 [Coemansia spiralis]
MWAHLPSTFIAVLRFVGLADVPTVVPLPPPPPPPGALAAIGAAFASAVSTVCAGYPTTLFGFTSRTFGLVCDHAARLWPASVAFYRVLTNTPISPPAAPSWTALAQSSPLACGCLFLLVSALVNLGVCMACIQACTRDDAARQDANFRALVSRLADCEEQLARVRPGVQAAANDDNHDSTTGEPAPVCAASKAKLMTIRISKLGVQAAANDDGPNSTSDNGDDDSEGYGDSTINNDGYDDDDRAGCGIDDGDGDGNGDNEDYGGDYRTGCAIDVNESDRAGPSVAAPRKITRCEANAAIVPLLTIPEQDSGARAALDEPDRSNAPVEGRRQCLRKAASIVTLRKAASNVTLRVADAGRKAQAKVEEKRGELSLKLLGKKSMV